LVDPRVSRDGIPLCARHADATTPPQGWAMNDLRSRNRALAAVPDEGETPSSTPPRVRTEAGAETATSSADAVATGPAPGTGHDPILDSGLAAHAGSVAHQVATAAQPPSETSRPAGESSSAARSRRRKARTDEVPASRPSRRREAAEEVDVEQDRFPWHHQYQDDEPEEMQASTPLLSRAFRSSTG
jgi:hypothetical protein